MLQPAHDEGLAFETTAPRFVAARINRKNFEREHGRILAPLLVADLGGDHRGPHCRRRFRLRVGAEVDHCLAIVPGSKRVDDSEERGNHVGYGCTDG